MIPAHQALAGHLAGVLPSEWTVRGWPTAAPDNIPAGKIAVQVWTEIMDLSNSLSVTHSVTLRLMVGTTPSQSTDIALTEALSALLCELYACGSVTNIQAQAAIFSNREGVPTYPGWDINANVTTANPYR